MKESSVDILLATYNGEKYIEKQIDSIINQTYKKWNLFVRDDGSTDKTLEILNKYKELLGDKIKLISHDVENLGAKNNFFELLKYSEAEYIFFCDQDDIWFYDKIEKTMKEFKTKKPTLVHTNAILIDENDNLISSDFWKYSKISSKYKDTNKLLVQNNITGCTMAINKELKDKIIYDKTEKILMHDWWIGLIASLNGSIIVIEEPTMKYRQHSKNEVGAKNYKNPSYILKKIKEFKKMKKDIEKTKQQSGLLFEIFCKENKLKRYSEFPEHGKKMEKIIFLIRNRVWKYGIARNIIFYILF